jgi:3-oxoacyl-[acyl-carrier-protein] synthase III
MKTFSLNLRGVGLVTPLGDRPAEVLQALRKGTAAEVSQIATTEEMLHFPVRRVPVSLCKDVARMPRLRRASPISHFATAAAMRCLQDAGLEKNALAGNDTAMIFAASDGSVQYTRRFFEGVETSGPGQGSPLLFPETVYNAPASHVAAALGLAGPVVSLVGDSAVAMEACMLAGQILHAGTARRVLVLAAEELDAIAVAGYASAGIAASDSGGKGTIFSEGAAALLLEAEPRDRNQSAPEFVLSASRGRCFRSPLQAARRFRELLSGSSTQATVIVGSCSGGGPGRMEDTLLKRIFPRADVLFPRLFLGDALTAASLWQIILAREILCVENRDDQAVALCPVIGHNGQIAVATLQNSVRAL